MQKTTRLCLIMIILVVAGCSQKTGSTNPQALSQDVSIISLYEKEKPFVDELLGEPASFSSRQGPRNAKFGTSRYLKRGLEVEFYNGKVNSVTLHNAHEEWAEYQGSFPLGLSFSLSPEQVEAKLGPAQERFGLGDGSSLMNYTEAGVNLTFNAHGELLSIAYWKKPTAAD